MAWPAGITTRTVNFGPAVSFENGDGLTIELRVNASRRLVWAATGTPLIPEGVSVVGNQVEAVLELPVTDQAGYVDGKGGAIDVTGGGHSHYYTATITYKRGNQRISTLNVDPFAVPAGDGSPIDLDLLLPVTTGGATVSVPDTWSTTLNETKALAAGMVWQPSTAYSAGDVTQAPDGTTIRRLAAGTSGTVFDATEEAAWESVAAADGTLLKRDLSATFARGSRYSSRLAIDALAGLGRNLDAATRSTAIQVLSDSTSNDAVDWPYLLASDLAADRPEWTVRWQRYDDAAESFQAPTIIQTGTDGPLYLDCSTGTSSRHLPPPTSPYLSGAIDVRMKLSRGVWTETAPAGSPLGATGVAGERSWYTWFGTNNGRPGFIYSTDGTALTTLSVNTAPTVADGATTWIRWLFVPDNGAGSHEFSAYQSADGITWTQLGSTVVTAGTVTLFDNTATRGIVLGSNSGGGIADPSIKIYEVEVRDGLNGPIVAPVLPDLWTPYGADSSLCLGAPVLTMVVGSKGGGNIAYLSDPIREPKLMPDFGQAVVFLSQSHNMGMQMGREWFDTLDAWVASVAEHLPAPPVLLTQNPQKGAAVNKEWHAQRSIDTLTYSGSASVGAIDTYRGFVAADAAWETALMADDVHPNSTGGQVLADLIRQAIDATI